MMVAIGVRVGGEGRLEGLGRGIWEVVSEW